MRPCSDDPDPCGLHSGYPGDEYCLLPPPPGRGIQLHVGPTRYTDPAELEPYLVRPGQDLNSFLVLQLPTDAPLRYGYVKLSMRPGAHHLVNTVITGQPPPGFTDSRVDCGGQLVASFPSTSAPILESPPQHDPARENAGLVWELPSGSDLCVDYHRYNTQAAPILSEAWYNIWFADPEGAEQLALDTVINAGPFEPIAGRARQLLTATSTIENNGRILSLLGHRHVATWRLSVTLNDMLIYQSYDWSDPRRFQFDSVTINPVLDLTIVADGAVSGPLTVSAGDRLRVECEIYNASLSPKSFGSALATQEMCALLISTVDARLAQPSTATIELPP